MRKKLYKVAQSADGKLACDVVWETEVTNPTDLLSLSIPRDLLSQGAPPLCRMMIIR